MAFQNVLSESQDILNCLFIASCGKIRVVSATLQKCFALYGKETKDPVAMS